VRKFTRAVVFVLVLDVKGSNGCNYAALFCTMLHFFICQQRLRFGLSDVDEGGRANDASLALKHFYQSIFLWFTVLWNIFINQSILLWLTVLWINLFLAMLLLVACNTGKHNAAKNKIKCELCMLLAQSQKGDIIAL